MRLKTLLLLTSVLGVVFSLGMWVYHNWDEYHVATLNCGDGRLIYITAATSWEVSQPVYYKVVVNGETVTPTTYFTNAYQNAGGLRFDVVTAEDTNLVGIVQVSGSGERDLAIMHDCATGESWPRLRGDEVSYMPSVQRKWQDYFDRLQRENPDLPRSSYFTR